MTLNYKTEGQFICFSGRDECVFPLIRPLILNISGGLPLKEGPQLEITSLDDGIFQIISFSGTAETVCEEAVVHSRGKSPLKRLTHE